MLTSKKENIVEISLLGIDIQNCDKYNSNLQQILKNICEIHEVWPLVSEIYTFKLESSDVIGIRKNKHIVELNKHKPK